MHYDVPGPDDLADQRGVMMITMDPPRHTALRQLVNKGFTPRRVAKLNEHIADMARDLVDRVIGKGQCDFANDIAGALPSYVIAEMLGIPLEDGYRLYELTEIANSGVAGDHNPRATEAGMQMFAYAGELAARKRAQPGDDIATSLVHAEFDGQRLTDMEFIMFFVLLIVAGGDTTRNLVAGGMGRRSSTQTSGRSSKRIRRYCRRQSRRCCATSAQSSCSFARPRRTPNCGGCA